MLSYFSVRSRNIDQWLDLPGEYGLEQDQEHPYTTTTQDSQNLSGTEAR